MLMFCKKYCIHFVVTLTFFLVVNVGSIHAQFEGQNSNNETAYVQNEVVVKYKENYSPSQIENELLQEEVRSDSLIGTVQNIASDISRTVQREDSPQEKLDAIETIKQEIGVIEEKVVASIDEVVVYETNGEKSVQEVVAQLEEKQEIEFVEPNYIYSIFKTPNDAHYSKMWNLPKINAPAGWDITQGSENVVVAVIDLGIERNHPDLQNNIVETKNFTGCPGEDSDGHGTHVAGTVAASGDNSTGVVGLGWRVKIMALKVGCNGADITLAAAISAIDYAVSKRVNVINMSMGGAFVSRAMADAISNAVQNNIAVVVAAGNSGGPDSDQLYPANDPNVITVSATGPSDELAHYSSYGNAVDVAAPGGNPPGGSSTCSSTGSDCIVSTYIGGRYVALTGTSMAAPQVTGLIALLFSKDPTISVQQIRSILETTSVDLGASGKDPKFGYGRIDVRAALDAVSNTQSPSPTTTTNCQQQQKNGDYNCDSSITMSDFESWRKDFIRALSNLSFFEGWRSAFQNK